MRRWRNLPFRRGSYWQLPMVPQPGVSQPPQRRTMRLYRAPRGQFFQAPVPATAVTPPPPWAAPLLRQARRWLPARRRTQITAPPAMVTAAPQGITRHPPRAARPARGQLFTVPPQPAAMAAAPAARHALRLARPPRGQFLPVPPPAVVAGATGPLVPPHLHQRRAWPPRISHGHRADPPWLGQAAPPPTPPAPQIPRQPMARARLPRRGCLLAVPPARMAPPPPSGRRARPAMVPARRGCIFRTPQQAAPPSPGPLIPPYIRPSGNRPRWPARPRHGARWQIPLLGAPPPPFTIGALTAATTSATMSGATAAGVAGGYGSTYGATYGGPVATLAGSTTTAPAGTATTMATATLTTGTAAQGPH
jgi:hypothetical protein